MLVPRVQRVIQEKNLIRAGERVLVGVSGGLDSSVLLHVLVQLQEQLGFSLVVAHLNHRLRGAEAELDAAFVREKAQQYGLTCVVASREVSTYSEQKGVGIEEAGRMLRYDFFYRVAIQEGCRRVAVAHHADDQVETVIMRLIRGTGLKGLAGIPEKRPLKAQKASLGPYQKPRPTPLESPWLIRPLLPFFRSELEDYCKKEQISYRTDRSNFSDLYQRNRVRMVLLPLLCEYNPRFKEGVLNLAKQAAREESYLAEQVKTTCKRLLHKETETKWVLELPDFFKLHEALQWRVIQLILDYLVPGGKISRVHVENVLNVLCNTFEPQAALQLPGAWTVHKRYHQCLFEKHWQAPPRRIYTYPLPAHGRVGLPEISAGLWVVPTRERKNMQEVPWPWAVFDAAFFPKDGVVVRNRREGDRMVMDALKESGEGERLKGTKKVKDMFIDAKWPSERREMTPLVAVGQHVLWIPGLRQSADAPVTEDTEVYLYLVLAEGDEDISRFFAL